MDSTIQKLALSELTTLVLRHWGEGRPYGDEPVSAISGKRIRMTGASGFNAGIWEAAPGSFVREVESGEYMHILAGAAVFVSESGSEISMDEGDLVFFPPHTKGVWHIHSALRKLYIMFEPAA